MDKATNQQTNKKTASNRTLEFNDFCPIPAKKLGETLWRTS